MINSYEEHRQELDRLFGPDAPAEIVSAPDVLDNTVCACAHWFEEHNSSCNAPGCKCLEFVFCNMYTKQREGTWGSRN